jgi:molybdopterin converting factor small subunit
VEITIRLFAGLREVLGSDRITEAFEADHVTVEDVRSRLEERHEKLRPYLPGVAIAVNEEYILEPGETLKDGDTVALIPPIAGGALDVNETRR